MQRKVLWELSVGKTTLDLGEQKKLYRVLKKKKKMYLIQALKHE